MYTIVWRHKFGGGWDQLPHVYTLIEQKKIEIPVRCKFHVMQQLSIPAINTSAETFINWLLHTQKNSANRFYHLHHCYAKRQVYSFHLLKCEYLLLGTFYCLDRIRNVCIVMCIFPDFLTLYRPNENSNHSLQTWIFIGLSNILPSSFTHCMYTSPSGLESRCCGRVLGDGGLRKEWSRSCWGVQRSASLRHRHL